MNPRDLTSLSPSLPSSILYPATIAFVLLQAIVFWRVKDRVANFVIFAVWSRYMLAAFHFITYKPVFGGLSLIALSSVGTVVLGLLVIETRNLTKRLLVPCYMLIAAVIVSGLANGGVEGIVNVSLKFGYFIVVTLAVFEAINRLGEQKFLSALLWVFAPPLVLQGLSIVLGIYKDSEGEGSASFIGGYEHEASFSVILVTCFIVASMSTRLRGIVRNGLLLISLVGIYFANYRTTMVAIAPMAIAQFSAVVSSPFRRNQRLLVGAGAFVVALFCAFSVSWLLQQRFEDISTVAESRGLMIKPPADFSVVETRTMSGRPYIWSTYIYAYLRGSALQHIIGFGPESWYGFFATYAHNTLVSYLYEYGAVGVILITYWWAAMVLAAARIRRGPKATLLVAHVSFILLNMATMPLWMIEGVILYGIICGYTLYLLQEDVGYADESARLRSERLNRYASGSPPRGVTG